MEIGFVVIFNLKNIFEAKYFEILKSLRIFCQKIITFPIEKMMTVDSLLAKFWWI